MCGNLLSNIFGGGRSAPPLPPTPAPPTPPPAPSPTVTAPVEAPATPTPAPYSEDETKRKAKVTSKKVQKKKTSEGTSQLQINKPEAGGVQGTGTPQGVNPGTGGSTAGGGTTKKT